MKLVIKPTSDDFDPDDSRWQKQVDELYKNLKNKEEVEAQKEVKTVEGMKGGGAEIIIALGSAGAFTVALEIFKAWLRSGRKRKLGIEIEEGNVIRKYKVTAEGMDKKSVDELMNTALNEDRDK